MSWLTGEYKGEQTYFPMVNSIVDYYKRNRAAVSNPQYRSSAIASSVNNKQSQYNGYFDKKPDANLRYGKVDTGIDIGIDPSKVETYKGLDKEYDRKQKQVQEAVKPTAPTAFNGSSIDSNVSNYLNTSRNPSLYGSSIYDGINVQSQPLSAVTDLPQSAYDAGFQDIDYSGASAFDSQSTNPLAPSPANGSMFGDMFSNADGFYYRDASNMPAGLSPQAQAAYLQSPSAFSQILGNVGSGVSAIGGIYDIYNAYQSNKMAKDAYNAQKSELARQVQKDKDFSANINKSGLGTRA